MSRYPEIRAGQRITGAMLTGIQFEEIVKQAATVRANDATVSSDPDLQFTLEANATYHVEFYIQYTTGTGLFKTDWSVPSGASGLRRVMGPNAFNSVGGSTAQNGGSNAEYTVSRWGVHGFTTLCRYGYRSDGGQNTVLETGIVTTSSAGTLALRWAQNATNATAAEVSAFSYGRIKRVA